MAETVTAMGPLKWIRPGTIGPHVSRAAVGRVGVHHPFSAQLIQFADGAWDECAGPAVFGLPPTQHPMSSDSSR